MDSHKVSLIRALVMLTMPRRFTTAMVRKKVGHFFPSSAKLLRHMRDSGQITCEREPGKTFFWYTITDKGRQQADFAFKLLTALDLIETGDYDEDNTQLQALKAAAQVVVAQHKSGNVTDAAIYDLENSLWD